jgi:4-amino-4-deoxy-L-arabinose transferase-like glycosyltransferase
LHDEAQDKRPLFSAAIVVSCIVACKFLVHLYAGRHYGYFIDELCYLACSRHLDWGYVDQPPLIALIAWVVRFLLGQSLLAIRFFPAVAGAAEVALTALIARELGGGRFAQALSAICVLVAPAILGGDSLLTMNAFEPLFWMGCAYLVVRIIKTGNQRLWMCFGVIAGVGVENKYSMAMFAAGIFLGLLLASEWWWLANRWVWIGGAIAFLIFVPNLWWNIRHHFPFLELQANIQRSGRNVPLGLLKFLAEEILTLHPLALPIWLGGLWFFFCTKAGKPFRAFGWAWVFSAVINLFGPKYGLPPAISGHQSYFCGDRGTIRAKA